MLLWACAWPLMAQRPWKFIPGFPQPAQQLQVEPKQWSKSQTVAAEELQTHCSEFRFPDQRLAFFSYLPQTQLEAVCGQLSYTWTSEVMRTAVPALAQITPTTWHLALSLAQVWPWSALLNNAEALFGTQSGQRLFKLLIMVQASLFWEGKGMESIQMDADPAMYFLPSWPTVPVVQRFPESEM